MTTPRLLSIGLAAPEPTLDRESALAAALEEASPSIAPRLRDLYRDAGVSRRGVAHPTPQRPTENPRHHEQPHPRGPTTAARLARFLAAATDLAAQASRRALTRAEIGPDAITHLVTVSCTGAQSPGLDHALMLALGLNPDVSRTNIGFMGCHGAINALAVAGAFARADPSARVLVACAEICSLHRHHQATWDQEVANAIFADGAASAVIAHADRGPRPVAFASRVFPDTTDLMTWKIGDHGFEMRLAPRVPAVLKRSVEPWIAEWLGSHGLSRSSVAAWAVHPGGRDILEAVRRALDLEPRAIATSAEVLDSRGNMSSGTVLWVLDALLRAGASGPVVALSFGPGLTGEALLLHV